MMKVALEFEIEELHCLKCPLREQTGWDNCTIQKNEVGYFLEFENWEEQMKDCPLKVVNI